MDQIGHRTRRRSPSFPAEMIAFALQLADEGAGQSEIQRAISKRQEDAKAWSDHQVPHLNTIKLWLRNRKNRAGERWNIGAENYDNSADPALVLPVLGALVARGSAISHFTVREAEVLTRVREVRPDWEPVRAWHLTRDLISADGDERRQDELHALLALSDEVYETKVAEGYYTGIAAGTATIQPDSRAAAGSASMGAATPGVS